MLWDKHPAWPRSFHHWRLVLHVLAVVMMVRFLLQTKPLPDVVTHLVSSPLGDNPDGARTTQAATFIDGFLTRFPAHPKGNCLPRSLALLYFATRQGIPVQFHCGVRKNQDTTLDGHARLSFNQTPFLERGNPFKEYTVTFSFSSEDASTTPSSTLGKPFTKTHSATRSHWNL